MEIDRKNIFAALVHYPVLNKRNETVATSITTLDLHDLARITRTFGLERFFVVTPLAAQRSLIDRIRGHWMDGGGAEYNPSRKEAFKGMEVVENLDGAIEEITRLTGKTPKIVVTGARSFPGSKDYATMKNLISSGDAYLILFGTGYGLASEVIERADYIVDPILGGTDYNHLPVRGASAIVIDRLLGK